MNCGAFEYTGHAVKRLFERGFRQEDVEEVVRTGEEIARYPDEKPYPCVLVLGYTRFRPVHVVVAFNATDGICQVVTMYEPDPALWSADFKTKHKPKP